MGAIAVVQLAFIPILIGINAFYVAGEYAVVTIRSTRIEELRRDGFKIAHILARLKDDLPGTLATIQICITATNLLIGAVAEPAMTSVVVKLLAPLHFVLPEGVARGLGLLTAILLATFFTVVLSELIPKALTIQYTDRVAMLVARPIAISSIICRPLSHLMNWTANRIVRLLGLEKISLEEQVHSEEELEMLVDEADAAGEFHHEHGRILRRAFDFADLHVRHVMIPLKDVSVLPSSLTIPELASKLSERPFTRWVLCDPVSGQINGIINVKMALFALAQEAGEAVILHDLAVTPTYLDPDLSLLDALTEMRRSHRHLCIVRDPEGEDLGIVTLEDVLESVVGNIPSESAGPAIRVQPPAQHMPTTRRASPWRAG
jgi:CBS domain containing-hemolysin-like protein